MQEMYADLWMVPAEYRVITTNGFVKKDGRAVMGRGCAKEAAQKYPKLPRWLGIHLLNSGNHVHLFPHQIITMPVKHVWWEPADLDLIERSTKELVELVDGIGANSVALPRPGCGNGQLVWEDVNPMLERYLDDRFVVVDFPKKGR